MSCQQRIENQSIKDYGKKQIGENLYIKKVLVGEDRVYFLVNEKDEVVTGTSTSYTVSNGKSTSIKSNSIIINTNE
jgi:mRNA-degrading endonuclease RelE of RelBE toxin-antitoxin system